MSRLVTLGGEVQPSTTTGSPNPEYPGGATGTVAVSATTPRTGAGCIRCTDNTGSQASFVTLKAGPAVAASATIYARIYAMIPGAGFFPVSSAQLLALQAVVSARITSAGTLQLWNETGTPAQIGSSSAALTPATYYRVELKLTANASSQITTVELRLDGATVVSASGLTLAVGSAALNAGWVTTPGGVKVVSLDDIAVNDGAGTANNSWPGDGAVVMLFPTADSAVGTGWTLGTGTAIASNGFDAVNNVTPQGLADLQASSDPKQIRNAASAANSNYDATMTTYTAAGVPAGATINAVVPWTATAAPVTTSAKAGTVGVVSNPAITNVALSAAGTAGAFWQGVAAGIWPTGWKWSSGTITEAPAVTLGTAPVMRITQVTASTRIAMVCFMGIYVDYTPATPTVTKKSGVISSHVPAFRAAVR